VPVGRVNAAMVLWPLVAVGPWSAADASVLEEAGESIRRHRQEDAALEFRLRDGTPVRNAQVRVRQTSHHFRFGNYIRPRHYANGQYLERFRELFNFVQLLEFNWGQYEPDQGRPLLEQRMQFIRDWCAPNGLTRFYGHMLVWTRQYAEYPRTGLPVWLFNYDKPTQYELLRNRIRREVTDYRDIDIMWDVVNEAVHCRVWGDWEKDSYIQNQQPEPLERVIAYVRDALSWAHDANPKAQLLINDYRVIVEGRFRDQYTRLVDALLAEGVPLSAIGIQAHEPYKGRYWYTPEELWETYELFGTQTGLPIYISEFFYVSDAEAKIEGNRQAGNWSEELQADAIEEFYRVTFAHPAVKAIVYFGLPDSEVTSATCGLLHEDYSPKPAWDRLKQLIWDEWTTTTAGLTSATGRFGFRGFFGAYEAELDHGGETHAFEFHLEPDQPNEWAFTVGAG
jgi:endo-1,4-beta-xylanase